MIVTLLLVLQAIPEGLREMLGRLVCDSFVDGCMPSLRPALLPRLPQLWPSSQSLLDECEAAASSVAALEDVLQSAPEVSIFWEDFCNALLYPKSPFLVLSERS